LRSLPTSGLTGGKLYNTIKVINVDCISRLWIIRAGYAFGWIPCLQRLLDNHDQTTYVALISRYFPVLKGSDLNRETKSVSGDPSVNSDVNSSWPYYVYLYA